MTIRMTQSIRFSLKTRIGIPDTRGNIFFLSLGHWTRQYTHRYDNNDNWASVIVRIKNRCRVIVVKND